MNKKVKWSVISVSTITALTFGGLVMNNEKAASNENSVPDNDSFRENFSVFNEDEGYEEREYSDDDRYYEEHDDDDRYEEEHDDDDYDEEHDDDDEISSEDQEQGSSWGRDQFRQAPERGFRQNRGSSGTSR